MTKDAARQSTRAGWRNPANRVIRLALQSPQNKQAQDALRQSEERLRSVLDSSLNCIYRINLRTQRFEFVSSSATRITNFTPDEFMTQGPMAGFDMIHPDDLAAF